MGVLRDLNQMCKSGDETRVKKFLYENSSQTQERSSYAALWSTGFESSARRTAADRRMMTHEFEVACSSYV